MQRETAHSASLNGARSERHTNMTRLLIDPLMILVIAITTVLGCGVMPPGQGNE
ncbi:hypothetical protein KIN20_029420 [Parelaphostrongylus tenuis]|uniref:Uncharacterized protein n=1 Tax=Parelaphostrongylus tenuis TaxID=148309 RepID=A0AAD5R2Q9_PARTN|nr:hypothetical protein KIN20_029420 [Parelaphostrongylus tenuis]